MSGGLWPRGHARACPGHPRRSAGHQDVMAGTSPAMTCNPINWKWSLRHALMVGPRRLAASLCPPYRSPAELLLLRADPVERLDCQRRAAGLFGDLAVLRHDEA